MVGRGGGVPGGFLTTWKVGKFESFFLLEKMEKVEVLEGCRYGIRFYMMLDGRSFSINMQVLHRVSSIFFCGHKLLERV